VKPEIMQAFSWIIEFPLLRVNLFLEGLITKEQARHKIGPVLKKIQ